VLGARVCHKLLRLRVLLLRPILPRLLLLLLLRPVLPLLLLLLVSLPHH